MRPIRVLVVDDSAAVRHILRTLIAQDPELAVAGVAANGLIALAMLEQVNPDLVTLDIEMPEMDGLATLRELRARFPRLPVIMFSTLTERGAVATLEALSLGASDYVTKPSSLLGTAPAISSLRDQLIARIKALCKGEKCALAGRPPGRNILHGTGDSKERHGEPGQKIDVVAIGTSTGGPNALSEVLPILPRDFPAAVLVVQHMPPLFTKFLAERLAQICQLPVGEAYDGQPLLPGVISITPGDQHLVVSVQGRSPVLRLLGSPPENSCRPSVDVLFRSLAKYLGPRCLAVVMTGMGQDGLIGAAEIVAAGGEVWAQDAATSIVWGMPGYVVRNGLAERIYPLSQIGPAILSTVVRGTELPLPRPGRMVFTNASCHI